MFRSGITGTASKSCFSGINLVSPVSARADRKIIICSTCPSNPSVGYLEIVLNIDVDVSVGDNVVRNLSRGVDRPREVELRDCGLCDNCVT